MRLAMEPPAWRSPRARRDCDRRDHTWHIRDDDPRELGVNRPRVRVRRRNRARRTAPPRPRAAWPDGVYVLSRAVARPELRLLRLGTRPVRPHERSERHSACDWYLRRSGDRECAVAAPFPFRSARVGVAILQLWKARLAIDAKSSTDRVFPVSLGA